MTALHTRRGITTGTIAALGVLAMGRSARAIAPYIEDKADKVHSFSRTSLHQEVDFAVPPHRIYDALLDEKQFAAITGLPAKIDRNAGGTLWMFGGRILGRNIELVPDRRIVQAWRESDWPLGVYSVVHFELVLKGSGTHMVFDQTGFQPGNFWHLNPGWYLRYWNPLKAYLK